MGTEAFTLRIGLNRKATPGVRIVAQPLPESYWEVVPREALKPGAKGIIPLGPALFVVAEPFLLPPIPLAHPVAMASPGAKRGGKTEQRVKPTIHRLKQPTHTKDAHNRLRKQS